MITPAKRSLFLMALLIAFAMIATPTARAHEGHEGDDHPAAPGQKEFKGDLYLLDTDPVTDQKLPEKPVIYMHEGRELRFADEKNLGTFKAAPDKYLSKIDEQMIAQQLPFYPLATCMVSGDKLGGDMGKPINLIYKNRLVRYCCKGCIKDFKKDPDKFITKLNEAVVAQQGPTYPMTKCMVSDDKLGGDMGKPIDFVVGNRLVRFCCKDCVKDFDKNPLKYLKMIDDAAKAGDKAGKPAK